ncbi:MAG TPA: lysophospholipid acyltransferase family protein, partial [Haliangiales bacterium]|nr:lysophospholipid acyltransferase family protein [Haliangiales bacterium]
MLESLLARLRHYGSLVGAPPAATPFDERDPEFIAREIGLIGPILDAWYAPEVTGLENLPAGRALTVGTHNGGYLAPDMFATMVAFWRQFGPDRPAYGLVHDLVFRVPLAGKWIARLGGVPANPHNAAALLERDVAVLVYPGGDRDAFKPYARRHVVDFAGRMGFIRTALRARAPIVPVVSVGAHEGMYIFTDGHDLAERLGLTARFRLDVLPIMLSLPFGLTVGATPYLPVPTRVRVRALPAIDLGLPPEAADDAEAVRAAHDRVRVVMQAGLDALVEEGGFGP